MTEVEFLREESRETELNIEGEYLTEEQMQQEGIRQFLGRIHRMIDP